MQPADVGQRNGRNPGFIFHVTRDHAGRAHGENRWPAVLREGVVPPGRDAAGYLQIDALIAAIVKLDQPLQHGFPAGGRQRVVEADGIQTVLQPVQVRREPEQPATVDGDDLVDTIAKQEAAIHDRDMGLLQRQKGAVEICGRHRDGVINDYPGNRDLASMEVEQRLIHDALPDGTFTDPLQSNQMLSGDH